MQDDVSVMRIWNSFRSNFESAFVDPDVLTLQSNILCVIENQIAIHLQIVQNRSVYVQK